jgi:uncharacterized protein
MKKSNQFSLFGGIKILEGQICDYLNTLSESSLLFKSAIPVYLEKGAASDEFQQKLAQVDAHESNGDKLRRVIEAELYTEALIPDSRADVLGLMEELDRLLNFIEYELKSINIETPEFPVEYHDDLIALTDKVVLSIESCVLASRAFFRDANAVKDHIHKVMFYEKEADMVVFKLKKTIFASNLTLDRKSHLKGFVEKIDALANLAEDIADDLAIFVIKRAA